MNRQTVLLLFGGESSEHDVSVMSAKNVFQAINVEKYDVSLAYIDSVGKWWLLDSWQEDLNNHQGRQLVVMPGGSAVMELQSNTILTIDVLLPILHGENGHEDGSIQGLANLAHFSVIGSGLGASAVCWDKLYTKQLLYASDILVTPYFVYSAGDAMPIFQKLTQTLGDTLFVKPTIAGSSIGVSKVHNEYELEPAIVEALRHSSVILIEKAITGQELEVAVLGNPPNHQESGVGEIIPGEEFYSYEDKYSPDSNAQVLTKANIDESTQQAIQSIAHRAYQLLGCRGLARVDFFLSEDGKLYINEFNTLPGFTSISQFPKLWQEQGVNYSDLINRIIELALKQ